MSREDAALREAEWICVRAIRYDSSLTQDASATTIKKGKKVTYEDARADEDGRNETEDPANTIVKRKRKHR